MLATLATALAACGKTADVRPQWTVVLSTDAPVPQFGDRLLVEVLDEQGATPASCSVCTRQLGADTPQHWPISFGITSDGAVYRVRVRLFRVSLLGTDGVPDSTALIDRTVTLPPTSTDLRVSIPLPMRCFDKPADVANRRSCDPEAGLIALEKTASSFDDEATSLLQVGSWPPATVIPCTGPSPDDMVCIQGGAFLLGDAKGFLFDVFPGFTTPERIVQLSPFRIDKDELTVKAFAALRAQHPELAEPLKKDPLNELYNHCTYGGGEPRLPLNCVTRPLAAEICAVQGKRLPTEAEWEFAAGNAGRESAFPWGDDDDVCHYAVLGRADLGGPSLCRVSAQETLPSGPVPGGGILDLTSAGVHDLGGSLSEWVADAFMAYTAPCWEPPPTPLVDPTCESNNSITTKVGTLRGGSWRDAPITARAVYRHALESATASASVGVRCARDGR
jgi:formylglycine-generating enzyme required for sulfatase activity